MKKIMTPICCLLLFTSLAFGQSKMKDMEAGNIFRVSLPDYMSRTINLNSAAIFQFKNSVKEVYGFIIEDDKEELRLAEMSYATTEEFMDGIVTDFAKESENRIVSKYRSKKSGENQIVECDLTCYFTEDSTDIYYFIGVVETPSNYYKLICWTQRDNQEKFRGDFQRILYSIKE